MCTVTCLPGFTRPGLGGSGGRLRVVFNRDEQRARLPGIPPRRFTCESQRVLMPRDADAGGTWIAVNESGVVLALLNVNAAPHAGECTLDSRQGRLHAGSHAPPMIAADGASGLAPLRRTPCDHPGRAQLFETRGAVIERLAGSATAAHVIERTCALDPHRFRPFRLLAFDRQDTWAEAVWTGERMRHTAGRLTAPLMRTSSGLGDAAVVGPRRTLFHELVAHAALSSAHAQDAFHRHEWPGQEHVSVLMSRPDARTVSITTVEVEDRAVRMFYEIPSSIAERSPS